MEIDGISRHVVQLTKENSNIAAQSISKWPQQILTEFLIEKPSYCSLSYDL